MKLNNAVNDSMNHHRTRTSIVPARPTTTPNTARQLSPLRPLAALTAAFSVLAPVLVLTLAPTPALGAGQPTPAALNRLHEVNICDRTQAVQDAILALTPSASSCAVVFLGELADITSPLVGGGGSIFIGQGLQLRNKGLTTLKAGDFKYLSGLRTLWLDDNQLTHLPAGVFDGTMTSLHTIHLENNKLRTSDPSVFNEVPTVPDNAFQALSVYLTGNELDTLPADMFTGLTTRQITLVSPSQFNDNPDSSGSDEPTANAKMTVSLVRDGNTLALHIPSGTPSDLNVQLYIGGTFTAVPMKVGQTGTTHTFAGSSTQSVTFSSQALRSTTAGNIGLDYVTTTATLEDGICNRTAAVQTALIAQVSASVCSNVTMTMLNGITGLDLSDSDIGTLLPHDFLGLGRVTTLNLSDNQLTTQAVPPSIFTPLTALIALDLSGNELLTLPDGIFEGVPATLASLDMSDQFSNSASTTIASLRMPTSLNLTGTTATLTIAAGAPLPLTFPLTLSGNAASSPTSVTIARGATTGTATLVQASGQTLSASLSASLPTLTGVTGLTLVAENTAGICDRTQAVQDAIIAHADVSATTCEAVTALMLAGIGSAPLSVNDAAVTSVKVGDFAGLTGLLILRLTSTSITELPSGIFNGMASLEEANFLLSDIETVPPDLFAPVRSTLRKVNFNGNNLKDATFPDGLFVGLARPLEALRADKQGTANVNATMRVILSQSGNEVTATLPSGAPGNTTVNLAVTGATLAGSPTSILVPVGTTSATVTLLPQGSATPTAAFASTTPVDLGIGTYDEDFDLQATAATVDICDRTAAVEAALLAAIGGSPACDAVPASAFQNITGTLDLSNSGISALLPDDFLGLTAITTLNLNDNQLTDVPASIFAPLQAMTSLNLSGNELSALPDGIFKGLPMTLASLDMSDQFSNSASTTIASLPMPSLLSLTGTTATLTIAAGAPLPLTFPLYLSGNAGSSPTSVSIATGATTGTVNLVAASNRTLTAALDATSLPTLTGVTGLTLVGEQGGICDRTPVVRHAIVAHRDVSATTCGAVTTAMLAGLGAIHPLLDITDASITSLPVGDFAGLSSLTELRIATPLVTELPSGIFTDLSSLETLNFFGSKISVVPSDLLAPMKATLTSLNFNTNNLKDATFPDGLFVGLVNPLTTLRANKQFEGTAQEADATMRVSLSQSGNEVTATLPSGAPGNTTVNLAITGATASGSPTSISIPVGTTSATVTLLPQGSATPTAAFAAATPGTPPVDLGVRTYDAAFDLRVIEFSVDICDRTPQVEAALLAAIGGGATCDAVLISALRGITGTLDLSSDAAALSGMGTITALADGDFAGLGGVQGLDLSGQSLSALTADTFAGLSAVTSLNLRDHKLVSANVAAGSFAPLVGLTSLDLSGNELDSLPAGIFKGLAATLTSLDISNQFKNSASTTIASLDMPLLLGLTGTTATLTIAAGAPLPLTFPLYLSGNAASSPTSVSIATGATTGTVNLVAASGQTIAATLDATNLPTLTGVTGLTLVGEQGGICDRTPVVRNAIVAHADVSATACADVTTDMLAGLGAISPLLHIQDASVTSLQVGDFAGLSSLTELSIATPLVTELPSGIFTGLSKLEDLSLLGSKISVVPSDLLAPMKATLDSLNIKSNNLKDATFPDDLFVGLAAPLTTLMASAQFAGTAQEADATMRVRLNQNGNEVTATLLSGAPGNTTVNLLVTGATASGSPTSILIPVGTTSATVTLLPQDSAALIATFASTTPVDLGVDTYDAAFDLEVIKFRTNICDRTPQVEAALLAAVGGGATCDAVLTSALQGITGTLDLSRDATALSGLDAITTLADGDFAKLDSVQGLDLSGQSLSALTTSTFTGLSAVTSLDLSANDLVPANVAVGSFAPLVAMTSLDLSGNKLGSLPAGIFSALTLSLTSLDLSSQSNQFGHTLATLPLNLIPSWASDTATVTIPAGAPADLTVMLTAVGGTSNSVTITVEAGETTGTTDLEGAAKSGGGTYSVALALAAAPTWPSGTTFSGLTIDAGICDRTPQVHITMVAAFTGGTHCAMIPPAFLEYITGTLDLSATSPRLNAYPKITALKDGDLAGLIKLTTLNLSGQSLTALKDGDLADLKALVTLNLSGNSLAAMTADTFTGLTALTVLNLSSNRLAALPAGIFTSLTALTSLDLSRNRLASLPNGFFSNLFSRSHQIRFTALDVSNQFANDGDSSNDLATLPLFVIPSWASGTATVTVPAGAPAPLTVTLTPVGATTTADLTITLARGATTGTAAVAASVPGTPVGLILKSASGANFSSTPIATGICDRTPMIQPALVAAISGASSCAEVSQSLLEAVTTNLDLSNIGLTTLRRNDFKHLTGLATLDLSDNRLTEAALSIPSFVDTGFTGLDLSGNEISSLPDNFFNNFEPEFVNLAFLDLSDQFGNDNNDNNDIDSFPFFVSLSLMGNRATVRASTSVPADLRVPLQITGATSPPEALVIGEFSQEVTHTLTASVGETIRLAFDGTPTWPSGSTFTGLTISPVVIVDICDRTAEVEAALLAAIGGNTACASVSKANLQGITSLDLSGDGISTLKADDFDGLTALTTLNLSDNELTTVAADIFAALVKLTSLDLSGNEFSALPAGIFSGLTLSLTSLDLSNQFGNDATADNEINSLPLSLTSSWAGGTATVRVPAGAPAELTIMLTAVGSATTSATITLAAGATTGTVAVAASGSKNVELALAAAPAWPSGTTFASLTIPTGICDRTPQVQTALVAAISGAGNCTAVTATQLAALTSLDLSGDAAALGSSPAITALKSGDFADLTELTGLTVDDQSLTALTAGTFTGLGKVTSLNLADNQLTAAGVPAATFTPLAAMTSLDLSGNKFASLTAATFTGLGKVTSLNLADNQLTAAGVPAATFTPLAAMTSLDLSGNKFASLTAATFTSLGKVTSLNLADNQLTAAGVPAATFAPLALMTSLDLSGNEFASLPDGLFSGLSVALTTLDVSDQFGNDNDNSNDLATLPLAVSLTLTGSTLRVRVPPGVPADLMVPLQITGATSPPAALTIAEFTQEATATLTASGSDAITAAFDGTPTWPSGSTFTGLTVSPAVIVGICDRTAEVEAGLLAAIGGNAACASVSKANLQGITSLDLSGDGVSALEADDFDGLTALTTLNLSDNELTTVPTDIFAALVKLTSLDLSGNEFSALPAGIFSGLTLSLTSLDLSNQFGNDATADNEIDSLPLSLTSSWAGGTATVRVPAGAPAELTIMLTAVGSATTSACYHSGRRGDLRHRRCRRQRQQECGVGSGCRPRLAQRHHFRQPDHPHRHLRLAPRRCRPLCWPPSAAPPTAPRSRRLSWRR